MSLASPQERSDCGVRALAVACNCEYQAAYDALTVAGRKPRGWTYDLMLLKAAKTLGVKLVRQNIGKVTVTRVGRELPSGRWIVHTSGHYIGVSDGEVRDWAEGTRKRVKYVFKAVPLRRKS